METIYKPTNERDSIPIAIMSLDLDKGIEGVLGEEESDVFFGRHSSCRATCRGGCRGCLGCRRCRNDKAYKLTDSEIDSLVYEILN
ncbi:MAG: hypothetical protein KJ566_03475 [Nanoarchaeota archaeon]|nr:hypothetical protein [Nanoarchaeota archaeon]